VEDNVIENDKRDAKQRIFNAAVSLFARKGYSAVGIRRIAKEADVNISMIDYYYGGKIGVLKAIVNDCYEKYYKAILHFGSEKVSVEENVRTIIHRLVSFFRENTELAMVAFRTIPVDIPEIIDLRIKWFESNRATTNRLYDSLGLDTKNPIHMSIVRNFLTSVVFGFFELEYCCSHIAEIPDAPAYIREHFHHDDHTIEKDDNFFADYISTLTNVYLSGIKSLISIKQK
jgi:AcrR family transcriptional regulator